MLNADAFVLLSSCYYSSCLARPAVPARLWEHEARHTSSVSNNKYNKLSQHTQVSSEEYDGGRGRAGENAQASFRQNGNRCDTHVHMNESSYVHTTLPNC